MVNVLIVKDDSFCTMNIGEKFDSLMLLAGIQVRYLIIIFILLNLLKFS